MQRKILHFSHIQQLLQTPHTHQNIKIHRIFVDLDSSPTTDSSSASGYKTISKTHREKHKTIRSRLWVCVHLYSNHTQLLPHSSLNNNASILQSYATVNHWKIKHKLKTQENKQRERTKTLYHDFPGGTSFSSSRSLSLHWVVVSKLNNPQ